MFVLAWNSQTREEEERRNAGYVNGHAQSAAAAATTFVAKFLLLFTQMLLNEISFDCGFCYYGNMASLLNR